MLNINKLNSENIYEYIKQEFIEHKLGVPTFIKKYENALTNRVYLVKIDDKKYIFKLLNQFQDLDFNRSAELKIIDDLYKKNATAQQIVTDESYYIQEFLEGRTVTKDDFQKYDWLTPALADSVYKMHNCAIQDMINIKYMDFNEIIEKQLLKFKPQSNSVMMGYYFKYYRDVEYFLNQYNVLLDEIRNKHGCEYKLCHNDLNIDNIIINPDTKSIYLIDFEYSYMNDIYFEFSVLHRYLSTEQYTKFIQQYMKYYNSEYNVRKSEIFKYITAFIGYTWCICMLMNSRDKYYDSLIEQYKMLLLKCMTS